MGGGMQGLPWQRDDGWAVARWRAGPDSQGRGAGQSGRAGESCGETTRSAFFFLPPPLVPPFFFLTSFLFFKEKHIQLFNAAPAKSRRSEDGGRCRSRRRLKGDMHFFFPFVFFLFVAARAPGNAISHDGEAAPARRRHPSTYVELGNYGLAENPGERRRQLPPHRKKRGESGKRKTLTAHTRADPDKYITIQSGSFHRQARGALVSTRSLWTYAHPRRPSRAALPARQPFCRSCFPNVQLG